jgi:sugar lactone lactonase YvrE
VRKGDAPCYEGFVSATVREVFLLNHSSSKRRMSKVSAHRHVTWVKQLTLLGATFVSLCATAGCSARATGEEDIVAISREKQANPRNTSSGNPTLNRPSSGSSDPFLEPSDAPAAGSGGSSSTPSAADAGSGESADAASPGTDKTPLGNANPGLGDPRDVPRETVLFWVDAVGSRMWRANAEGDGTDRRLLAGALSIAAPDGITVDLTDGFIYWTNMGTPVGGAGVGSLQRMRLDDEVIETVIPIGTTSTPKQINIDNQARQLYWSDRDAMVWRSELDGSAPQVILSGHNLQQPAGMGLDVAKRQMYITDRTGQRMYRVGFDMPEGATAEDRADLEILAVFPRDALPLNIALDLGQRKIYWTDRLRGAIYRMNMDLPPTATAEDRTDIDTVISGLTEPVGIAFDDMSKRLYFTELSGRVSRANLDGSGQEVILTTNSASGIALAHLPE